MAAGTLSLSLQWSSAENPFMTVSGTSHDGACGGTVHVRQNIQLTDRKVMFKTKSYEHILKNKGSLRLKKVVILRSVY